MSRYTIIRAIYEAVPKTYKCVNQIGEHIVQLPGDKETYATLEKLTESELMSLAQDVKINIRELEELV